ncbi:MAG: hypothetical protein LBV69_03920 [Bacteroidales bacterium]|jgi:hypothetical protein|nr:hypothetical protein [Bacteroidales bacterium]
MVVAFFYENIHIAFSLLYSNNNSSITKRGLVLFIKYKYSCQIPNIYFCKTILNVFSPLLFDIFTKYTPSE